MRALLFTSKITIQAILLATLIGLCTEIRGTDAAEDLAKREDCGGMIAVLPTFQSDKMKRYLESKPPSAIAFIRKLREVADQGDKEAQFTLGRLLILGYCVPQDLCKGQSYTLKSRGGKQDWEKVHPLPPPYPEAVAKACQ